MLTIVLELAGASRASGVEPALAIGAQLDALTRWDELVLRDRAARGQPLPPIYESGVRYRREVGEVWFDALRCVERGFGDCEDLACWRAAELRVAGDGGAGVFFTVRELGRGRRLFHILVRRGDGSTEDPSRALGMGD